MTPAQRTLTATRNTPFVCEWAFRAGAAPVDLTGWTGRMELRLYEGQPGAAKLSLGTVTGDAQGVWIVEPAAGRVRVRIDEAALRNLPGVAPSGSPFVADAIAFAFDLILTDPTGFEQRFVAGIFNLNSGVTD